MRKLNTLFVLTACVFVAAVLLYLKKTEAGGMPPPPPLIVKMERARELLNAETLGYTVEEVRVLISSRKPIAAQKKRPQGKGKGVAPKSKPRYANRYRVSRADFFLAVSAGDGPEDIRLVRFSEILPREHEHGFSFETADELCDAEHTGGIGIGRRYEARCEGLAETLPVLAARYAPFRAKNLFVSREKAEAAAAEAVLRSRAYSPFSEMYAIPEHIAFGDFVLREEIIGRAYALLRERKAMSRSFPGKPVGDVVSAEFMYIIALNEHGDHGAFDAWGADVIRKSALTMIAQNRFGVYPTCNASGACGLMQFTNENGNGTYALVIRKYPEAALLGNFPEGAFDPVNAVMGAALLFDYELSELPEWVRNAFAKDPRSVVLCLATAYHSGGGTAKNLCARQTKTVSLDAFLPPVRLKKDRPDLWHYLRKFVALEKLPSITIEAKPL